jgi:hypothetical protein
MFSKRQAMATVAAICEHRLAGSASAARAVDLESLS